MPLPLQPSLTPWSAWQRRTALVGGIMVLVLLLGWFVPKQTQQTRLLDSGDGTGAAGYLDTALRAIRQAKASITVVMYVMRVDDNGPVVGLLSALSQAAERGVAVRVLLDRGTDWKTGEPDAKHVAATTWLRAHGIVVDLDELERTTHAKVIIIDQRRVILGSHNWTRYALTKNREWSVVVDDPDMARAIETACAHISRP